MKRKLSKILGIALTVAMLASLLVAAAPAAALTQPTVNLAAGSDEISKKDPNITIYTKTGVYLGGTANITITFPEGTVVDNATMVGVNCTSIAGTVSAGPGWDNATPPVHGNSKLSVITWRGDADARTITAMIGPADNIRASAELYINITKGVTQPTTPGTYTLAVHSSGETTPVTSTSYTIKEPTLGALPGVATAYNAAGIAMNQSNKIQDVIGNAGEGGKIVISAGTYTENIVVGVNKITLEAANGVIIPATGDITINGNEVTITGFTFKSSTTATDRVVVAGDKAKIDNCTFEEIKANDAIQVNNTATGTVITNNTIAAGTKTGINLLGAGTANAEVTGNTMTVGALGFAIQSADNITIKTNTITGSSGTGIKITGGTVTIEGNTLNTLDTAIDTTAAITVKENTIDGCGNAVSAASVIKVNHNAAANTTFTNNVIQNCNAKSYAFDILGGGTVNANFNNIVNNTLNVKSAAGAQNFKLNWWGSADGPAAASITKTAGTVDVTSPLGSEPGLGTSSASFNVATVDAKDTAGVAINSVTAAGLAANMQESAVSKLSDNPVDSAPPVFGTGAVVGYWDIYVKPANANDVLTVKIYSPSVTEYTKVYYGGGLSGSWSLASNQGVNVAGGYAWFTTNANSTPSTSELTGTPFALVEDKTLAAPSLAVGSGTSPALGAYDIDVDTTFTWGAVAAVAGYQIEVSEDPTFTMKAFEAETTDPFYKTAEALSADTTYYWRVRGVIDAAASAYTPWATGIFTTAAAGTGTGTGTGTPTEVIVTTETPEVQVVQVEGGSTTPAIPTYLLWVIVVVGVVLVVALIVLIVRTRRVA